MKKNETTFIDGNPYRLPTNLTPIHQNIKLIMPKLEDPGEDKYLGITTLQFEVAEPTNVITLNSKGIEFEYAAVFPVLGQEQEVVKIDVDEEKETVSFYFEDKLVGKNMLSVGFSRKFNPPNKMRGLHESEFTLPDGTKRVMATTQFESTSARECFPCCDDPLQKSTFQTTLVVPEDRTAISTTEVVSEKLLDNDLKEVKFAKTPRMPTYLLAFIVGDWEYLESETNDGIRVRAYATPGNVEKLGFALETTVRALEWFGNYHDFSYKNIANKCDVLAIPDFEAGAMENIGAITFREVMLFVDEERTSTSLKRRVAEVICHELEHQWKGNLVTPAWWNNLWLKESFATFMAYKCMDALFPEWNVWDEFVSGMASGGKSLGSMQSAHPIEVPVKNPDEIDQIYDAISYNMGGSVLRMLEDWLGENIFRDGIRLYVDRHQFSNTKTEDLWAALEQVSGEPVLEVMNTWTKQTGYPVVSVNKENGNLVLRQERFLINRSTGDENKGLWSIPITYRTTDNLSDPVSVLMREKEMHLPVEAGQTVQLNVGQAGVFRVNYEESDLKAIKGIVEDLGVSDRLVLAEDLHNLMRAGYGSVQDYLEFVSAYRNEENHNVWSTVVSGLGSLSDIFFDHENADDLDMWASDLLSDIATKVGWNPTDGEKEDKGLLRQTVLGAAAAFGNSDTIQEAKKLFGESDVSLKNVSPDLQGVVLSAVARQGDNKTFEEFIRRYEEAINRQGEFGPELSLRYMQTLSNFEAPNLLVKALDYSLSDKVRPQDAMRIWGVPIKLKKYAWEFLKDNWEDFDDRFGSTRIIGAFISGAIAGVPDAAFADEVEEFFQTNPAPRASERIKQSLEGIRVRASFRNENEDTFRNFFSN